MLMSSKEVTDTDEEKELREATKVSISLQSCLQSSSKPTAESL